MVKQNSKKGIFEKPRERKAIENCYSLSSRVTSEWTNLLENLNDGDLDRKIEYVNTKGEKYLNAIEDITMHVINHSTYHRAQIAQKVKILGGNPAVTDYIFFQRNSEH